MECQNLKEKVHIEYSSLRKNVKKCMKLADNDLIHKNIDWWDLWLYLYGEYKWHCQLGVSILFAETNIFSESYYILISIIEMNYQGIVSLKSIPFCLALSRVRNSVTRWRCWVARFMFLPFFLVSVIVM